MDQLLTHQQVWLLSPNQYSSYNCPRTARSQMRRCGVGGSASSLPISCQSRRWFVEEISEEHPVLMCSASKPRSWISRAKESSEDDERHYWLQVGMVPNVWHPWPRDNIRKACGSPMTPQPSCALHFAKPQRPKSPSGPSRSCVRSPCEGCGAAIEAPSCTEVLTASYHFLRTKWPKQPRSLVASQ